MRKRSLVEVTIVEETIDEIKMGEKKHKWDIVMKDGVVTTKIGVLDDQHLQEL